MLKVGIIRCQQTEDLCPGTTDFKIAKEGKCCFEEVGPVEIIGFVSCGGCPGKRIIPRIKMMIDRGIEGIVLASCLKKGTPLNFPCPHFDKIIQVVNEKYSEKLKVFEWTH